MKNRLLFTLWIAILAILWLAGNLQSAGVILADSLLAAVILAVQAAAAAKNLRTDCRLKGSRNGEKQASLQIDTNYNGLLPVKLYLRMQVENQLTGEKQTMRTDGVLAGRGGGAKNLTVELEDTHAGKLQVQIEQIAVTDLFGLLRFRLGGRRKQNKAVQRLSCLMLPQAAIPPQLPDIVWKYDQNSDIYAEDRSGPDQSQTYELRDYRSGDSLRSIHWKRSSRSNSWIVREGSWPVGQSLLLLLENSYPSVPSGVGASGCGRVPTQSGSPQDYDSQDAIERACAGLIALSEELTDRGILHDVGWWAKETQKIQTAEIRSAEDLIQALGALLGATLEERKKTIWERFSQEYGENSFSQVIIIDDETAKTYNL